MSTIARARPMTVPEALARVPSSLYRMTLKQYETMIAAGSFTKRDRVQLINGYLVTRMTELPPHGATCEMIRLAIEKFFSTDAWHFRNEKSLRARKLIIVTNDAHCVTLSVWAQQKNLSRNTACCFRT